MTTWLSKFKDDGNGERIVNVDSEWDRLYQANRSIVPDLLGPLPEIRKTMTAMKARMRNMMPATDNSITVEDRSIDVSHGPAVPVRIYTPSTGSGPWPLYIYMHGGGWALGDLDSDDNTCRTASTAVGVKVISIGYRLAPEDPYPAAVDDCWATLQWVLRSSDSLNINKSKIIIGGTSAGANLAAVITRRARIHNIHIQGQLLRMPALCHMDAYPPKLGLQSIEECKDEPILPKTTLRNFYSAYVLSNPEDIDVSPLLANDFEILPPTHLQICGKDPLRDEGLAYADKLVESGIPCTVNIYPGVPHGFSLFPELAAARKLAEDTVKALAKLVEG